MKASPHRKTIWRFARPPYESIVAIGLNSSLYGVTAHHRPDGLIGMARIVGDGAIFFEIVKSPYAWSISAKVSATD